MAAAQPYTGTPTGDLWQPLTEALAGLELDRATMKAVVRALAEEDAFPVLEPVVPPEPEHRDVVRNPVTKQWYALRKTDVPVLAQVSLAVFAAGLGFTDHKAIGAAVGALTTLVVLARSGIVELDPLHALVLRAIKKGPREGSFVGEIATRLGWTEVDVAPLLVEIQARREGLIKQTGDLWAALV